MFESEDITEANEASSTRDTRPYQALLGIFQAIENPKRGVTLLAVGLGELYDQNTLDALIPLVQHLSGTEWTNAQFKKQIAILASQKLILRSEDKMLGTEEVSYHALSLLGHIAIFYLYLVHEIDSFYIEKTNLEPVFASQSISQLARFLSRHIYNTHPIFVKLHSQIQKKEDFEKIRGKFLLDWGFPNVFGDKDGAGLKIIEELLLDHLSLRKGISRKELQERITEARITTRINKLIDQQIVIGQSIGRETYYFLSVKALYLLIPLVIMVYLIVNIEGIIFEPKDFFTSFIDEIGNDILLRNTQAFLKNLYAIESEN